MTVDRIVERIVIEKVFIEKPAPKDSLAEESILKKLAECEKTNSVTSIQKAEQKQNVCVEKNTNNQAGNSLVSISDVSNSDISNSIEQQLLGWSRAWSQGDFKFYIKSYSEQFVPSDDRKSFAEWKKYS